MICSPLHNNRWLSTFPLYPVSVIQLNLPCTHQRNSWSVTLLTGVQIYGYFSSPFIFTSLGNSSKFQRKDQLHLNIQTSILLTKGRFPSIIHFPFLYIKETHNLKPNVLYLHIIKWNMQNIALLCYTQPRNFSIHGIMVIKSSFTLGDVTLA